MFTIPVGYHTTGGIAPFFVSGGTVTSDGDYSIHTFTASDTLTVTGNGQVEYLVVAGGGGGGGGYQSPGGGGGGAGGLLTGSIDVSTGVYNIVVGAGGTAGIGNTNDPGGFTTSGNGGNSSFNGIVATGGGGGASYNEPAGKNGGSGGGASYTFTAGTGIAGQGFAGAITFGSDGIQNGAGGGGAGGVAPALASGADQLAGAGGPGISSSITGSPVFYAGGGAGGQGYNADTDNPQGRAQGGVGGGGAGGLNTSGSLGGIAGTPNTGGGGGGAGGVINTNTTATGGDGGSGIVIIRYIPIFQPEVVLYSPGDEQIPLTGGYAVQNDPTGAPQNASYSYSSTGSEIQMRLFGTATTAVAINQRVSPNNIIEIPASHNRMYLRIFVHVIDSNQLDTGGHFYVQMGTTKFGAENGTAFSLRSIISTEDNLEVTTDFDISAYSGTSQWITFRSYGGQYANVQIDLLEIKTFNL